MRSLSFGQGFKLAVLVLLVSLAATIGLAFYAQNQIHIARNLQETRGSCHDSSHTMMTQIKNAQLAQQSFVVSGNPIFLDDYKRSVEVVNSFLENPSSCGGQSEVLRVQALWKQLHAKLDQQLYLHHLGEEEGLIGIATSETQHQLGQAIFESLETNEHQAEAAALLASIDEQNAREWQMVSYWLLLGLALVAFLYLTWFYRLRIQQPLRRLARTIADGHASGNSQSLEESFLEHEIELIRLALKKYTNHEEHLRIKQAEKDAALLRLQEEFSSMLAHELRTPLNTMLGRIEHLLIDLDEPTANQIQPVKTIALSMVELVNSTLDYQKIKRGCYVPNRMVFKPSDVVHSLVSQLFDGLSTHRCLVDLKIPASTHVLGDKSKITQALFNLMGNAKKFTPTSGSIRVSLSMEKTAKGEFIEFAIADTGIGIPATDLERIFKPFEQASKGRNRRYEGTGLGLTLSREIAHCLGGDLSVESTEGMGSTFTFRVPATTIELNPQSPPVERNNRSRYDLRGKRILMVEDHQTNAKISASLLIKWFECVVDHVENGEQALSRLTQKAAYDIVLMDINLGEGINGLDTARLIMETYGDESPAIVASL